MYDDEEVKLICSDGSITIIDTDLLLDYKPNGNHFSSGYLLYQDLFLKVIGFTCHIDNRKERKIDAFLKRKNIPEIINPVGKLYINNQFEGYAMNFISCQKFKNSNIFELINELGTLLEHLHSEEIIVGDVSLEKIICDKDNKYHFVGIDDFGIDSIEVDVKSPFLRRNFKKIVPNKTTDIIMYKKMIAEIILNRNFDNYSYLYFKLIIKASKKLDLEMKEFLLSDSTYLIKKSAKKDVKIKKRLKPC